MNHKQKVKLARRNMSAWEKKAHTPMLQSVYWENRRMVIAKRVQRSEEKSRLTPTKNPL